MADDDEEVIFEGHPLDEYLKEIGFRDYESATRIDQKSCEKRPEKCNMSTRIVSLLHKIDVRKYITPNWWTLNKLDSTTVHKVIDIVTQSRLLSEEDFELISSLDFDKENHHTDRMVSWHVLPLGGLVGAVSWALRSPLVIIGLPTLLLYAIVQWAVDQYHRCCLQSVATLVEALQELQATSKKALRRLQENELIARGFMFSVTGSSVERLENSSLPSLTRRWCTLPGLREGLLSALVAAVHNLTQATQALVQHYPLRGQLDKQQFYLAFQETDFLTGLSTSSDGKSDASQEIKIEVLKVLQNCYLLLQSEFLRRLVLTFHPELRTEATCVNPKIFSELLENMSVCAKQLDNEYRIFSTYGMPQRPLSSESLGSITTKKLKYDTLFVSVHSTTLHLQNILYRTHAFEEYLETRENLDDVDSDVLTKDLQIAFNDILKELDMCRSCCEQGISFLNNLASPEASKNLEEDEDQQARNLNENENIIQIHVGKTELDPVGEDEVFEAVSTADYFDDSSDLFDATESSKTEKQQQKNCSKLMLDELKIILVDKAKEWKEREEKALKNKRAKEGICETENTVEGTELADELASKTEVPVSQSKPVEEEIMDIRLHNPMFEEHEQANSSICSEEKSSFANKEANSNYNHLRIMCLEDQKSESKIEYPENSDLHDICVPKLGLSSPFGLHAAPLSHKFMLKDSEIFCGTGENSSSEDSGNE